MKPYDILTALVVSATMGIAGTPAMAQDEDVRVATAWLHDYDYDMAQSHVSFGTFPFANPIEFTPAMDLNLPERYDIDQPVKIGDHYYFYVFTMQIYGYDAIGLYRYDIEDNSLKMIADYGAKASGTAFSKLCYDHTDGTLYCVDGYMGYADLSIMDLETGIHKSTCTLKVPIDMAHPNFADHVMTIAINYDGDMYGLTYWGHIVKINKYTGECRVISTMDYNPDNAFMYAGSTRMFFDHETGDCYLSLWTFANRTEIRKIDLETGHSEQFAPFGDGSTQTLYGIDLPFTVAEPSAPGKVTGLTVTRGAAGACEATVSWTNPVKTYGRNGTLEELDKIEVYRSGELVHTVENPVIGGKETFTDHPDTPDYYTYRVVGYNGSGAGDRVCTSEYIGMGIPQMPQDVVATNDGDDIRVSWTMPEFGSFDAYIDYADVVYDVTRYEGYPTPVGTLVAEGLTETGFTDSPDHAGEYFYSVVARNNVGTGEAGQSERMKGGPAIRVPYKFGFSDSNANRAWTIIDGNGDDDGWKQQQSGPFTFSMNSKYNPYVGYAAMEYLISPQTLLEEGKRYKLTFQAKPGSDKVPETLAVSFGKEPTPMAQDSVAQFTIVSKEAVTLRANLPAIKETGRYNFGFVHRTAIINYDLSLLNAEISEDHEGYALVTVKDTEGNLIPGVKVSAAGVADATADKAGLYHLDYLPAGETEVSISALGYRDATATVDITEWETTPLEIVLEKRPAYKLSGIVKDAAGDPVKDAKVTVTGYADFTSLSDGEGHFELPGIWEAEGYNISVAKNRHMGFSDYTDLAADLDLGTIVLADDIRTPRAVTVTEDSKTASLEWTLPANDVVTFRNDDGGATQFVGLNAGTNESVFGSVFASPATVYGTEFYIGSVPNINHWSVQLYIFDLNEDGTPSDRILYRNTYVSVTDDQWTRYELPAPVDAPNGFYMAISTYGNICLAVDGAGDTKAYPFREGVNYFSQDYTTGKFISLEQAGLESNFMLRAYASPYDDDAMPRMIRRKALGTRASSDVALDRFGTDKPTPDSPYALKRVLEDRLRYDVYRFPEEDESTPETWDKVASEVNGRAFSDNEWQAMERGIYKYAVTALYADGAVSEPKVSDIVGRDMHTDLLINVFTDTEENLSAGASMTMNSNDGRFHYTAEVDDKGRIELPYTWKGTYTLNLAKEGFDTYSTQVELGDETEYLVNATLRESKHTPVGLKVVYDGRADRRTIAWNIPELIKDSFEKSQGHDVFTPESEGYLGWSYFDGDGAPSGGLNYEWPHQFEEMSWMTFNPDMTNPSMLADGLMPLPADGDQFLLAVSSGEVANEDWIISPRLFFDAPFGMQFEAAGWNPGAEPETLEVGYSLTDTDPESFIWMTPVSLEGQVWTPFTANFVPETRYIAIRYISSGLYMAMLDNIKIGNPTHIQYDDWEYYTPSYTVPVGKFDYEIFLNGSKLDTTDRNVYELKGLTTGHYQVAVRSVYSSGYSDMVSAEFDVDASGVEGTVSDSVSIACHDRHLTVGGPFQQLQVIAVDGTVLDLGLSGEYDLTGLDDGVYIIRVVSGGVATTSKIILQ